MASVDMISEIQKEGSRLLVYVITNIPLTAEGMNNISLNGDGLLVKLPFIKQTGEIWPLSGQIRINEVRVINKDSQPIIVNVGGPLPLNIIGVVEPPTES
jgi:hypothetical protein